MMSTYDIADKLADIPSMISRLLAGKSLPGETLRDLYGVLADLENEVRGLGVGEHA